LELERRGNGIKKVKNPRSTEYTDINGVFYRYWCYTLYFTLVIYR